MAQLLALLDGLQSRAGIYVLATTNRPRATDPALRRPGRFDRVVWMKRPDAQGRTDILSYYLKPLRLSQEVDAAKLATDLAATTQGASGADLEKPLPNRRPHMCKRSRRKRKSRAAHDHRPSPSPSAA